jgi:hypothetical protein
MSRDGKRAFEHTTTQELLAMQRIRKERIARAKAAKLGDDRRDLLPAIPLGEYRPVQQATADGLIREVLKMSENEIYLTDYEEALAAMQQTALADGVILPRFLCRKTGQTIGFATQEQWLSMVTIWPNITIHLAEQMLAAVPGIAPQALFSHPRAIAVIAAIDPIGAAILALESSLQAEWSAVAKAKRRAAFVEQLAAESEEDRATLPLIAMELAFDALRLNADWIKFKSVAKQINTLLLSFDLSTIIETLKDTCAIVAQETLHHKNGLLGMSQERRAELLAKHGAQVAKRYTPVIGEASHIRRAISLYCRDYSYLLRTMTDHDLLLAIGSTEEFQKRAKLSFSDGKPYRNRKLDQIQQAMEAQAATMAIEELFLGMTADVELEESIAQVVQAKAQAKQAVADKQARQNAAINELRARLASRKG